MGDCAYRVVSRSRPRLRFPESNPPGLNHSTLIGDPRPDRSQGGAPILAAGQLSERWMIEDGRSGKRGVIVAALVHPGTPPDQPDELFIAGGRS